MFSRSGKSTKEARKLEDIPRHELDAILCRFFAEIRKKDGHEYQSGSLGVMQCSLDRHLKNCSRNYSICKILNSQIQGNTLKRKQENYQRMQGYAKQKNASHIIVNLCDYDILFWK